MSKQLKCKECNYYYQDENSKYATCHFVDEILKAPCEEDDYEEPDIDEEVEDEEVEDEDYEPADIDDDTGYDPYLGCITDDC